MPSVCRARASSSPCLLNCVSHETNKVRRTNGPLRPGGGVDAASPDETILPSDVRTVIVSSSACSITSKARGTRARTAESAFRRGRHTHKTGPRARAAASLLRGYLPVFAAGRAEEPERERVRQTTDGRSIATIRPRSEPAASRARHHGSRSTGQEDRGPAAATSAAGDPPS